MGTRGSRWGKMIRSASCLRKTLLNNYSFARVIITHGNYVWHDLWKKIISQSSPYIKDWLSHSSSVIKLTLFLTLFSHSGLVTFTRLLFQALCMSELSHISPGTKITHLPLFSTGWYEKAIYKAPKEIFLEILWKYKRKRKR